MREMFSINLSSIAIFFAALQAVGATLPPLDTLTPDRFTIAYSNALLQKKPAIAMEVPNALHLRTTIDGRTYNTFLDNEFNAYLKAVPDLKSILEKSVHNTLAIYSAAIIVDINRIVPVIKTRDFLHDSLNIVPGAAADSGTFPIVFDDYNDRLIILYGQDVMTHISYFGSTDLKKACISRNNLREISISNLTRLLPPVKTLEDNGFFMVNAGGRYEASLILCSKFWNRMQFPVNGEIVISIPSQDIVLVTGKNDNVGKKKITALACKLMKESRCPLAADLFVLDSGVFRNYNPGAAMVRGKAGRKK